MKFPSMEGWPKAGVVDITRLLFSPLILFQPIVVPTHFLKTKIFKHK
jgi:hypothetical protein